MSKWKANKQDAITHDVGVTMTDQSAANQTDINVIVKQFGIHGQAPGTTDTPMYEDFTRYPEDLRGFYEQARGIETLRENLPETLRGKSIEELINLTPDELNNILTPAPTPPKEPEEQK